MARLVKRLELRLDETRLKILESEAKRTRKSIAELIRQAIDRFYRPKQTRVKQRLKAVHDLGKIDAPVSSWEKMEEEIAKGMLL